MAFFLSYAIILERIKYKKKTMRIEDIMTRDVITVTKETPLKEAAGLLAKFRIHGMPVVDEAKKVIGIVTESDFFTKDASNIFLPTFLDFVSRGNTEDSSGMDPSGFGSKTKIADIMTKECITIKADQSIEQLIQFIKKENFNSMPVVDDQGALAGIVSIMDVIKLL